MPFRSSNRRGKWLSRAPAAQDESRQPLQPQQQHKQRSRYYQKNHNPSSPINSATKNTTTTNNNNNRGNDTSWTHSESSFERELEEGQEMFLPVRSTTTGFDTSTSTPQRQNRSDDNVAEDVVDYTDDVSSVHFGESVTGYPYDNVRGRRQQQEQQRRRQQEQPTSKRAPPPLPPKAGTFAAAVQPTKKSPATTTSTIRSSQQFQSDLLLDTIALAQDNNKDNNNNNNSKKNRKGKHSMFGSNNKSQRRKQQQQKAVAAEEQATREKSQMQKDKSNSLNDINIKTDSLDWKAHDSPADSASEALLSFVSNMTLGSAGALTSTAVGLSLLTASSSSQATTTTASSAIAARLMVQESLERHIKVCLDHCRASNSTTDNPFADTSLPVDVDDVSFVHTTTQGVDEAALQHVAEGEATKAIEIFRVLLQNQRKQRGVVNSNSSSTVQESEIARTKSRLAVLSLLIGNTRNAWQYATSALQTHKKAEDLPVHVTLSTMELGLVQFQTGKLNRALRAWREALQLACMTLGYDHLQVAILLNNLGCLHYYLGNVSASLRALEESLELQRMLLRSNSQCANVEMPLFQMATTMGNLAMISAKFKCYESSVSFLEEAIAIQESLAPTTSDNGYDAAENYLAQYTQLRDADADSSTRDGHATAEEIASSHSLSTFNSIVQPTIGLFGDVDGIPRRHEASKHNRITSRPKIREDDNDYTYDCILLGSLVNPGTAQQLIHATMTSSLDRVAKTNQPDFPLADDASFSSASLVARKKQSIPVDLDGEAVIDAEFHLEEIHLQALDHLCRNEFKDALDLFECTLQSHKTKYGEIHHLVGTGLHNCGYVHMMAENYNQAKFCFQEAVVVRTDTLGDSHPDVAASMFKIGMIEMANGNLECALNTFMGIVTQLQKNMTTYGFGPEAKMLNNMGVVLYEMGRDADAFDSFHKAYEIQKGLIKDSQGSRVAERSLANTMSNLGFIYAKQGEYNEALKAFQESLAILTKHCPLDHPSVVVLEENLAHVRAYGAADDRQQKSHPQSNMFASCARLGKEASNGGYAQSKITACFQLP